MKTYNVRKITAGANGLKRVKTVEGQTIERKVEMIVHNKEPIKDGAPLIYTEKSKGVEAGYDIRTDRFEIAVDAMDRIQKQNAAKASKGAPTPVDRDPIDPIEKEKKGEAQSVDGTSGKEG